MIPRKGDWIQTISGRQFWPLDPRPEEVFIEDIAWALSMLCRYGGHCRRFYSVAEHSVWVSDNVPEEDALWGLLHDATEAYLVDVPRPVKRCLPAYRAYEDALARVIAERFGLPWPMPEAVKQVDTAMLLVERDQLLAPPPAPWGGLSSSVRLDPFVLPCWSPEEAHGAFLGRLRELGHESSGVLARRGS